MTVFLFYVLIRILGGWSPYWVHSACWPLLAYCTCPRWLWGWRIWWNGGWQGKQKYSEKTCPSSTLSTTHPTWPDMGANPSHHSGKPVTNCLSYGAANMAVLYSLLSISCDARCPIFHVSLSHLLCSSAVIAFWKQWRHRRFHLRVMKFCMFENMQLLFSASFLAIENNVMAVWNICLFFFFCLKLFLGFHPLKKIKYYCIKIFNDLHFCLHILY
jgi:hypothetical protein